MPKLVENLLPKFVQFCIAEAKVNLAKGEAEAHRLLKETLTPEILQKQAIDKWNGKLPLFVGKGEPKLLDLSQFVELE